MEISCRNAFCTKIKRQPLYWQGISNEQRNKTDQAHVFKKSSLTEDHFPVYVITSQIRMDFRNETCFSETDENDVTFVTFLDLLSFFYCIGCSAAGFQKDADFMHSV